MRAWSKTPLNFSVKAQRHYDPHEDQHMISDNSWRTHCGVVNIMKSALLMGSISEQAWLPLNGPIKHWWGSHPKPAAEGLMAAGQFGWLQEVKASGPRPGSIHYPAPAATHSQSQPPPEQSFNGSFLLRDSPQRRPALDAWLDHHTDSPSLKVGSGDASSRYGDTLDGREVNLVYDQHLLQNYLQGNHIFPHIPFLKKNT